MWYETTMIYYCKNVILHVKSNKTYLCVFIAKNVAKNAKKWQKPVGFPLRLRQINTSQCLLTSSILIDSRLPWK